MSSTLTQTAIQYIDQSNALEPFCRTLEQAAWIGLDTEFIRERTYFPEFCLLQVATEERITCIDPLALPSLELLKAALGDARIPKILHSGRQDLEIFHQLWGVLPVNVFDTQIAVALSGGAEQMGYARLVEELFDIRLPKEHTRTDWAQRPLSAEQLRYAADDVAFLGAAYRHLQRKLDAMGRSEWLLEEMAALTDPALYATAPEDAWRRSSSVQGLPSDALGKAQQLCAWRERQARRLNLPRNWVLRDEALCQLATAQPAEVTLPRIRGMERQEHQRCCEEVRQLLLAANAPATEASAPQAGPFHAEPEGRALLKRLGKRVKARAAELAMAPAVLASRRDLEALVDHAGASRVTQGWRRAVIGEALLAELAGSAPPGHVT